MVATTMMVMVVVMMVIMAYLDVRDDIERGLLLSRGSVPTGGRCCGRLDIVRIIVVIIVGFFLHYNDPDFSADLLYQSSPGVDGEAMEAGEPREGSEPCSKGSGQETFLWKGSK